MERVDVGRSVGVDGRDALALTSFDCQWYGTMGERDERPPPTPAPHRRPPTSTADRWWQTFRALPRARCAGRRGPRSSLVLRAARPGGRRRGRRTPSAPADRRRARGAGPVGAGRGGPRRPRHPAALRRHRRRPDARPGLRARPGALLRDGLPAPRDRRPALASCSARTTLETDKFIRTLGWRRVAEQECALLEPATRAALKAYADGRQRLPRRPHARPRSRWSTPCSALERPRLHAPRSGTRSTRWPGSRRWRGTCAATWTTRSTGCCPRRPHPEQVAELFPRYPYDAHPPIVGQGAVVDGRLRADAAAAARPPPARGRRTPRTSGPLERDLQDGAATRCPQLLGHGAGSAATRWVVDGEHTATGKPLLANDPHLGISLPGIWMQMGLHCTTVTPTARSTSRGSPSPACPAWSSATTPTSPGASPTSAPTSPTSTSSRSDGDRWLHDGEWLPLHDPHRDHQGARRATTSTLTVRVDRARPAALRRVLGVRHRRRQAPADGRATAATATPWRWRGPRSSRPAPPTRSSSSTAPPTGTSSARPRRASRCPRRTSSTPTARATSATRRRAGSRSASPGNDGRWPSAGWLPAQRLDRALRAVRRRCRRCSTPTEGFIVTANQAVIDPDVPLPPHRRLGLRLPLAPDPRPDRQHRGTGAVGRPRWPRSSSTPSTRWRRCWCPTCSTSTCRPATTPRRPGPAARLGLHTSPPTARRRRTTTWSGATCSRTPSTTSCASDQWPDGGDRWFAVVTGLLARAGRPVVGRRGHRRGRDPRRHPAPGHDARRATR